MNEIKFYWNETKSHRLKRMRGLSFEDLTIRNLVELIDHPSRDGQFLLLFWIDDYIWAVPAVLEADGFFLKTLYPSRKHKKIYLERINHGKENEN